MDRLSMQKHRRREKARKAREMRKKRKPVKLRKVGEIQMGEYVVKIIEGRIVEAPSASILRARFDL